MRKIFESYKALPKEIYILCLSTLINRTGDFVQPFLTLLLSEKLGLPLHVTGVVVAVSSFAKVPGSYIGGKLNDHFNSKAVFVTCQTISGLILISSAFIKSPFVLIPLLITFSLTGSMLRSPTMAMISDILPPEKRQLGFSLRYIAINIGVAVGLALGGFIYNYSTILMFSADGFTMLLSALLILTGIKSSHLKSIREKNIGEDEKHEEGHVFNILFRRKDLLIYMILTSLLMIVFWQTQFALPMTMNERFGTNGPVLFGFLISINAVTATVIALVQQHSIKVSSMNQIIAGSFMFAVGFGLYSIAATFIAFALSTILWSIGEALIFTNNMVIIVNRSPENFRGRLTGVYSIISTGTGTLGILLTERIISRTGVIDSWFYLSAITLTAAVLLLITTLQRR